jgi:two-component system, sensor histidine kinase and response regulator
MLRSIRVKLATLLFVTTTIALCTAGLANYTMSKQKLNRQLEQNMLATVADTANNLSAFLMLRLAELKIVSRSERMRQGTLEQQLAYLSEELSLDIDSYFLHVGIANLEGKLALSDGGWMNIEETSGFALAKNGRSSVEDPYFASDGTYALPILAPVLDERGGVRQIIYLTVDATRLFRTYLQTDNGSVEDRRVNLFNGRMDVLYNRDPSVILQRNYLRDYPSEQTKLEAGLRTDSGIVDLVIDDPVKVFFAKVPSSNWILALAFGKEAYYAPQQSLLRTTLGVIAVTELALFLLIYTVLDRTVIRRIRQIANVTDKVARGNFSIAPIEAHDQDEIASLAVSVNEMTRSLRGLFEPFEAFIGRNQYAMIVTDADYRITMFNARAEEMLGYRAEELIGLETPALWLDHGDDARFFRHMDGSGHASDNSEWVWISRSGTRIPVEANISAMMHPSGASKGWVIVARDITAFKETVRMRNRLLSIVESAHDCIVSFDTHGNIFYMNEAGHRLLGRSAVGDVPRNFKRYLTTSGAVRFGEAIAEAKRHGYAEYETTVMLPDGGKAVVSQTIVGHAAEDGGELFFSAISRDITEWMRAQQEMKEASQAKSMFLARMSHEIRTPLNGIIGLSHLMNRTAMTVVQQDYMHKIQSSSHALLQIMNDILDFSKIEADKLNIDVIPFALEETVHGMCGTVSVLLGYKPIEVLIAIEPDIPPSLHGDPSRLGQVLLNLMSNAVKFTDHGMVRLDVGVEERTASAVRLRFTVTDTGIGMNEEQTRRLFQPFVQIDGSTSRKYGGTGLGLVIASSLVERMGGSPIEVASRMGHGSVFRFVLPFGLGDGIDQRLPATAAEHAQSDVAAVAAQGWTVLVAEDHAEMRDQLTKTLASLVGRVIPAASWQDAAEMLEKEQGIDVLMLDMEAEDMYGEETWFNMKRQADLRGIRTVVYTSLNGRIAIDQLAASWQPNAVMTKPVSRYGIRNALSSLVEHERLGATASTTAVVSAAASEAKLAPVRPSRPALLVVEDNLVNQMVTRSLLEAEGFPVTVAGDGREALIMLEIGTYGLILMDIHMPVIDGMETTRRIRADQRYAGLPIIALTADTTKAQQEACMQAGMNEVMTKPLQPDRLYAVLAKWLPAFTPQSDAHRGREEAAAARLTHSHAGAEAEVLDWHEALRLMDGKPELLLHVLAAFRREYAGAAARLSELLAQGDRPAARRFAHTLRGAAGNLAAGAVYRLAGELEHAIAGTVMNGELEQELLRSLHASISRLIEAIDQAVNRQKLE